MVFCGTHRRGKYQCLGEYYQETKARSGKESSMDVDKSTSNSSHSLAHSVKKNLMISPSSADTGGFVRDDEERFPESPKKRVKICHQVLRDRCSRGPIRRIGDLWKLLEFNEKGNVKRGARVVSLKCVVTENLSGRVKEGVTRMERDGRRFVYLADFTGFVSIGLLSMETGIMRYDVPSRECCESTRCSFSALVEGFIEWVAKTGNEKIPTFFLKNGYVQKIENISWNEDKQLMFPTSDVCLQMTKSEYASRAIFSTTGICGRVDVISENDAGDLLISLEDPVGFIAVQLKIDGQGETARSFAEKERIMERGHVFIKGIRGVLDIFTLREGKNAILKGKSSEIRVMVVEKRRYDEYVKLLLGMSSDSFPGHNPEEMLSVC